MENHTHTVEADGVARSCFPGSALPLVVSPLDRGDVPGLEKAIRACVEQELLTRGALLFRGFAVQSLSDFEAFVKLLTPELLDYEFGSTPRSHLQGRIYTSTEYPAHQHIPLHNEQAYTIEWPLKIWFYCAQAAAEGGNTLSRTAGRSSAASLPDTGALHGEEGDVRAQLR